MSGRHETPAPIVAEFGDGGVPVSGDGRLDAPSFHRNSPAVTGEFRRILAGRTGDVLEIGSGTGQHIVAFARAMPDITWWPSDPIPRHLASIEGWRRLARHANLRAPVRLDATAFDWPRRGLAAVVALNVLHIAPWPVALGLLRGAARHLAADGTLAIYGPFRVDGSFTAGSNARFDAALRNADPDWGVRDTADLRAAAADDGLALMRIVDMPSNNVVLVFERCA